MLNDKIVKSLEPLFKPRNVAIFEIKQKTFYFVEGFRTQGFDLKNMYLISSTENEMSGIRCYKSIKEIPVETIDYLILSVGRDRLIQSLKTILEHKKIKFIHIFTAGTGEFDDIGKEIEQQIKEILNSDNINTRTIGPNCFGIYCPSGKSAYLPYFPNESGNIGIISHSGDLLSRTIRFGDIKFNLKFSKAASIGNCINMQFSDFLEFYSQDDEIDIIGIYFEGFSSHSIKEGRKWYNILKNTRKPVLILRGGKTKRSQSAALTHTGSLGSDKKIWDGLYKQTPLIEVGSSLDQFLDCLYMFYEFYKRHRNLTLEEKINRFPKTTNALVILWSGGQGILDTDVLTELGINMPLFEGKLKEKLLEAYPNFRIGSLSNPLDLPWVSSSKKYADVCRAAISENIDLVIMYKDQDRSKDERSRKRYENLLELKDYVESLNKVFVIVMAEYPDRGRVSYYKKLIKDGFMVYPNIRRAGQSFLAFYEYGKKIKRMINNQENMKI